MSELITAIGYINQVGFPIVMSLLLWNAYRKNTDAINELKVVVHALVEKLGNKR
jgi:hypothetical protein